MQVKIQSIHFDADKKLLDYVQEKVTGSAIIMTE